MIEEKEERVDLAQTVRHLVSLCGMKHVNDAEVRHREAVMRKLYAQRAAMSTAQLTRVNEAVCGMDFLSEAEHGFRLTMLKQMEDALGLRTFEKVKLPLVAGAQKP